MSYLDDVIAAMQAKDEPAPQAQPKPVPRAEGRRGGADIIDGFITYCPACSVIRWPGSLHLEWCPNYRFDHPSPR